jgi:diguanylate cyclase (GGDEF)-like protein
MVASDNARLAASEALARKVVAERVRTLFESSPYGHAVAVAGIAVAVYGLYGEVARHLLIGWAAVQAIIAAAMIGLYLYYRSVASSGWDMSRWEHYFAAGAVAAGYGWGLFAYVLMPSHSVFHQILVIFIILAMVLAALSSMQASRLSFASFVLPALSGLVLGLVMRGEKIPLATAALASALSAVMLYLFLLLSREMEQMLSTRVELAATHDRLRDAVESIPDAFALFDADDRLALCNRKFSEMFLDDKGLQAFLGAAGLENFAGWTFEQLVRASIAKGEIIPPEFRGDVEAWTAERVRMHRNPGEREVLFQMGDGRWYQVRERRTGDGGIVGVRSAVTELKAAEERTRHLAHHDPLTGLPNRRLLQDRMDQAFIMARRNETLVGVLLIDLDSFKVINDRDGHRLGDEVLRAVAIRLRSCVREADTVARQGGDEFVVLLPEMRNAQDALPVAEKIVAAISEPLTIEGHEYRIGASIGVATYPNDAQDADGLLRCADQAMYRVKQGGRNGLEFFSA